MSVANGVAASSGEGGPLRDPHGRVFTYLRVALTERCNLRCVYCMPPEGVDFRGGDQILGTPEFLRLLGVAAGLGVTKVRFTGGEPLVRTRILELVRGAARTPGIHNVHLTSNGVLLERRLPELLDAGLHGVNISLDTMRPDRFERITRRPGVEKVLASIRAAATALPIVKVNVVAMRGINDDEIGDFAALTTELPITVRFVELMPFDSRQVWKTGRYLGLDRILERLRKRYPELEDASGSATEARVFRIAGGAGRIGVIPAYSRTMCGSCDRIRLTADGQIRNCLFSDSEFDLRGPLRAGADDRALAELIRRAMWHKPVDGWAAQRASESREGRESMTQIGG